MSRALGFPEKLHPGLGRYPIALFVVAPVAGADQVFPTVRTAQTFGDNMIDRHRSLSRTAVTAGGLVADDYILAAQQDLLARRLDIPLQPDHRRQGIGSQDRVYLDTVVFFDHLGLAHKNKQKGPFGRTDRKRLIILVQNQHVLA